MPSPPTAKPIRPIHPKIPIALSPLLVRRMPRNIMNGNRTSHSKRHGEAQHMQETPGSAILVFRATQEENVVS
jgi:hypothetical protein